MAPDDLNAPSARTNQEAAAEAPGGRPANSRRRAWAVRASRSWPGRSSSTIRSAASRRGGRHRFAGQEAGQAPPATASSIPATTDPTDEGACREPSASLRPPPAPPPGSKTITIIDGSSGKHQDVVIPGQSSEQRAEGAGRPAASGDHAPRRHPADRAGRRAAVRRSTPIRASCRPARPTRRASPSSSAASASARPAPPTRWRNCRRR